MDVSVLLFQPGKPTPTALPPGTPVFDIPSSYSLWASTDFALQTWNLGGDIRVIIQIVILIGLISIGLFMVTRFVHNITDKDAKD